LIDSGASFHMTSYKKWFCEYQKYNGGDVFLKGDSKTKIIGNGRVKILLKDRRIINLLMVFMHIPKLPINLISISTMSDAIV